MSLLSRRIIFYLLILLFFVIAPLLLARTAGYRYSFKQNRIVKTGALSIETTPDGAGIILNGTRQDEKTSTLITNLIPGLYNIILEREGYHPWQKQLTVERERTTFASRVPFFKKDKPTVKKDEGPIVPPTLVLLPQSYKEYKVFHDQKLDKIIVVDNNTQKRVAELEADRAIWRTKDTPLLFAYSAHEVWQFDPKEIQVQLVTRLIEPIAQVIPLPKTDGVLIIFENQIRGIELDTRDRQNSWDLATFDEIQNAVLSDDGKSLEILGTHEGEEGIWELELR